MTIPEQINQDLKQAMLRGNKVLATTLRGLKSVILYEEVAKGVREEGLDDVDIITLLAKEAKKRQESSDLFTRGGNLDKAQAELEEKKVIEQYLPKQKSEGELIIIIDQVINETGAESLKDMGNVMSQVKINLGPGEDGALIAKLVKERLSN